MEHKRHQTEDKKKLESSSSKSIADITSRSAIQIKETIPDQETAEAITR